MTQTSNGHQAEECMRVQRDLCLALGSATSIEDALTRCFRAVLQLPVIDCGAAYRIDDANGQLTLVADEGLSPELLWHRLEDGCGARRTERIMAGMPIYAGSAGSKDDSAEAARDVDRTWTEQGVRAWALIPIVFEGQVTAVLQVGSRSCADIPSYVRQTIESIAIQLSGVAARLKAEEACEASRLNLCALFDKVEELMVVVDLQGRILDCNSAVEKSLGYSREILAGLHVTQLHSPDRQAEAWTAWNELFSGLSSELVIPLQAEDGRQVAVEMRTTGGRWNDREVLFVAFRETTDRLRVEQELRATRDELEKRVEQRTAELKNANVNLLKEVMERKRAEEALSESEERFRLILENAPIGIITCYLNGRFRTVNRAFCDMTGYSREELLGSLAHRDITHPDEVEKVTKIIAWLAKVGKSVEFETRLIRKNGAVAFVSLSAGAVRDAEKRPHYLISTVVDVTEKRRSERAISRSERLAAMGTLAGGIAHDFNNILATIIGSTELVHDELPTEHWARRRLKDVLRASERAKSLVQQILAFGRARDEELKPVRVGQVVKDTLELIRASLPSTIEVRAKIASDSLVIANPAQIQQVIMNLCTNARHAMRDQGGLLEVELEDVFLEHAYTEHIPDLNPGPHLKLTVRDTGHGIDPAIINRVFDPYFSTKPRQEGTGLGLSVVHGIVKSCKGTIIVYSEPGRGASFNVYLPRFEAREAPVGVDDVRKVAGKERVLFVDDEELLVRIGKQSLERLGYLVTATADSRKALEVFSSDPEKFDIVLTDQTMPHMTGVELAQRLMDIRKDIPVILCTGFSETISEETAKAMGIREFIMKPFVMKELARVMRKILDGD